MTQARKEAGKDGDRTAVIGANEAFYRAFGLGDFDAMDALWARKAPVACIHPGWPALRDRAHVMESWRRILQAPPSPPVRCMKPTVTLLGDVAYVICYERLAEGLLVATNIFAREDGSWLLVHHQAGATAESLVEDGPSARRRPPAEAGELTGPAGDDAPPPRSKLH